MHWPAFWSAFIGRVVGAAFIAACVAIGFGPQEWIIFVAGRLLDPWIVRGGFIALAVVTTVFLFLSWRRSRSARETVAMADTESQKSQPQVSITSYNQSGGITAQTVNALARVQRHMGADAKRRFLKELPRDKGYVVYSIAGNEETHHLATEIYSFMKENGFNMLGGYPFPNMIFPVPIGIHIEDEAEHKRIIVGFPDGTETPSNPQT